MNKFMLFVSLLLTACQPVAFQPFWKEEVPPTNDVVSSPVPPPAGVTSVPEKTDTWQIYTAVGAVNIHAEPYFASPVVGMLYFGASVEADCAREDDFCEVTSGYIVKACLGIGDGKCR